jgi:hypothetical protein
MKLQLAKRRQVKIKMALQGPSGSGKTMSALFIAYGLTGDWNKVAVIDTENYSSSLYSHLGKYSVLNLTAPYNPEKYIEAINMCIDAGFEVIIIDSISHEWEGIGGILDIHGGMTGNSFTNWSKVTPRHNSFVQQILQSPVHILATIRSKQDYVLTEKNGKQVPEKVGLKGVTREGFDYEFTIVLDIDIKHNALASKDRTGLYMDKPEFKITPATGEQILNWCMQGEADKYLSDKIKDCKSIGELIELYDLFPQVRDKYLHLFTQRKIALQGNGYSSLQNSTSNGTANRQ